MHSFYTLSFPLATLKNPDGHLLKSMIDNHLMIMLTVGLVVKQRIQRLYVKWNDKYIILLFIWSELIFLYRSGGIRVFIVPVYDEVVLEKDFVSRALSASPQRTEPQDQQYVTVYPLHYNRCASLSLAYSQARYRDSDVQKGEASPGIQYASVTLWILLYMLLTYVLVLQDDWISCRQMVSCDLWLLWILINSNKKISWISANELFSPVIWLVNISWEYSKFNH